MCCVLYIGMVSYGMQWYDKNKEMTKKKSSGVTCGQFGTTYFFFWYAYIYILILNDRILFFFKVKKYKNRGLWELLSHQAPY